MNNNTLIPTSTHHWHDSKDLLATNNPQCRNILLLFIIPIGCQQANVVESHLLITKCQEKIHHTQVFVTLLLHFYYLFKQITKACFSALQARTKST